MLRRHVVDVRLDHDNVVVAGRRRRGDGFADHHPHDVRDRDIAAARADLEAATGRLKTLAPQTAEYAREQATIDYANARIALAG